MMRATLLKSKPPQFWMELTGILRKLRLINTRNRLTHALMQAVLALQAA